MDWKKLKKEREELDRKTKDLNLKKRMLLEQEKKLQVKRYIQLGELFTKAKINILDESNDTMLLGALLEIKDLLKSPEMVKKFEHQGKNFQKGLDLRYAISFKDSPSSEVKSKLTQLKFKWRPSLQEWHGRASFEDLSKTFDGLEARIEAVK